MRGGLTIDVYIPKGILTPPGPITRFFWFLVGNPIVFLPLVTLVVMFSLWWYKGRDPDPGISVAPMYEPPPGISPAEAGTLLDDSIHPRDITSTMVDLAVRGYIKIEETSEKVLLFSHKDYVFHLLKPRDQWGSDLAPHERVMLENVFAGGEETRLSSLKNRFYTAGPVIREDIMSQLKNKGIYLLDPESANGYSIVAAIVILIPFAIFQYLGWANFLNSVPLLIGCVLISAVIWWLFARVMTAKTVKGSRTRVAVLGFQEFMNRVDAERLKVMPPPRLKNSCRTPWRSALSITGPRHSPESSRILPVGTSAPATLRAWDSTPSSFRVRCTAWPPTCTRCSSLPRAPVLVVQDSAVVADLAAGVSPAAVSAAAEEAPSKFA